MAKVTIPKRLPVPSSLDPAEREYLRNILKYQQEYQRLIAEGLKSILPGLKEEAAEEIPASLREDSLPGPVKNVAVVGVFCGDKILLGRRRDSGKWVLPGGGLEPVETPRYAAARELYEEAGIRAPMHYQCSIGYDPRIHVFRAEVTETMATSVVMDPDKECDEWRWVETKPSLPVSIKLHHPNKGPLIVLGVHTASVRMDANIEKSVRDLFLLVQRKLMDQFPDNTLRKWAMAMVGHVNNTQKKNVGKVASAAKLEVEPLMRDGSLSPFFQNVIEENVGLIRSIPEERLASFKNQLVTMVSSDKPQSLITAAIQKNFKTTKAKARLLARDQVGKLNGALDQHRQQALGISRYTWRTVGDERVREDHDRLDGKVFSWDKPPITDRRSGARNNPGFDYQCRCYAEPVLDDILD